MGTFSRSLDVDVCLWLRMVPLWAWNGLKINTSVCVCRKEAFSSFICFTRVWWCGFAQKNVCVCENACMCVCVCRDYQLGQSTEVTETRVCCVMRHNKLVCFFGCMGVCVCVCVFQKLGKHFF